MKSIYFLFFAFICSFLSPLQSDQTNGGTQQSAIPDPLQLQNDWWNYFDLPSKELIDKIQTFEAHLDEYFTFFDEEKHHEALEIKNGIIQNLNVFQKKISQILSTSPIPLQFLKEYTPNQIVQLNQKMMQAENETYQLKDKIDFQTIQMSRIQSKLDKQIIKYQGFPDSSYEKLLSGLKIILLRVEIAIHKSDIHALESTLAFHSKEYEQLSQELKNAKNSVDYNSLKPEELANQAKQIQQDIDRANQKLSKLEKQSLLSDKAMTKNQSVCCLIHYKIITETIRIEYLTIEKLINELSQTLYDISQHDNLMETDNIRKALIKWEKMLSHTRQTVALWQKQLEQDHIKISTKLAESLKNNEDASNISEKEVSDIHLEIDGSLALIKEIQYQTSGAEHLIELVQNRFVEEKGFTETWLLITKYYWSQFIDRAEEITNYSIFYVKERPVTFGTLLKATLTIIGFLIFSRYLRRVLSEKVMNKNRFSKPTQYIILRLIHYLLLITSFLIALSYVGIDMTNIAIIAGALGVGIGFGLQSMVNNIISGFTLLLSRYIKIGDIVEIEKGTLATVIEINLQFTHICTSDGADKMIPNSQLSSGGFTNWTMKNTYRRLKIPFSVAYGTDKEKLKAALLPVVKKQPYVLSGVANFNDPQMWLVKHDDSSVYFELAVWVNLAISPIHATHAPSLLWLIDDVLTKEGIEIPFPQRVIYVKEFPDLKREENTLLFSENS